MNRNQVRKKIRKIASLMSELEADGIDVLTEYAGIEFDAYAHDTLRGGVGSIHHQGNAYVAQFPYPREDTDDE